MWQPDPIEVSRYYRAYHRQIKERFIAMYGGKCSCCGETHYEFLTIEHIHGQGVIKETARIAYKRALSAYCPDKYTVLCMNCNLARGMYGHCPHEKEKENELDIVATTQTH